MYQKTELQALSQKELKAKKEELAKKKAELEAAKAAAGKKWTEEQQAELDEVVANIPAIEEVISEKAEAEVGAAESSYTPVKGEEKMVHLKLVQGHQFNSRTGKEVSKPFVQKFTFSEWQLFKVNHKSIGVTIVEVLHDPYDEAKDYVEPIK